MAKKEITEQTAQKGGGRTKDLIYSGAFAAIYLVVMLVIVMGGSAISPLLYIMAPLFTGIITGTIYILAVLKVKSFVPAVVMGAVFALMMVSASPVTIVMIVVWTALACLVLHLGKYQKKLTFDLSFVLFNMNITAPFAMLLYARDAYIARAAEYNGAAYAESLAAVTPDGIYFAILAMGVVGGIIGALIANKLIDKHFKKAGVL